MGDLKCIEDLSYDDNIKKKNYTIITSEMDNTFCEANVWKHTCFFINLKEILYISQILIFTLLKKVQKK